jgi:2'-5' RNA ligase
VRLFAAAEIGEAVARRVAALVEDLRARVEAIGPRAKVTWIPADRLHLTIRFIGEVEYADVPRIRAVLRSPVRVAPFELSIAGAGSFPRSGAPRVLWAGVVQGAPALLAIERALTSRLAAAGIEPEPRPYRPHLTIARVREPATLRAATLLEGLSEIGLGTAHIDAITLFESRLSGKGSRYEPLERIQLEC